MVHFRIFYAFSDLLHGHGVFGTILFQVLSTFDFDFTFACIYHFIGFWTQQNVLKTYWKILPSEKSKQNVQFFYFSFWNMIFSAGMCCLLKPIANFAFFLCNLENLKIWHFYIYFPRDSIRQFGNDNSKQKELFFFLQKNFFFILYHSFVKWKLRKWFWIRNSKNAHFRAIFLKNAFL